MESLILPFTLIVLLSLFFYYNLIFSYLRVWKNKFRNSFSEVLKPVDLGISLVIPFRNEEKNLPQLIGYLKMQKALHFEVILVNDHSSDKSGEICNQLIANLDFFHLYNLDKNMYGKKKAIAFGISKSKYQHIVCTDADCYIGENWVLAYQNCFVYKKPDFIIAPVKMSSNNLFERLQSLEFFSLIASGAASALNNKAIMCNGANLGFTKELYLRNSHIQNQQFASGEDIMLLLAAKKSEKKIEFCSLPDIIVETRAAKSLSAFFSQRMRWASKSRFYRDFDIIYTSILVFLIQFLILMNFILSFYSWFYFTQFIFLFILKSIPDYYFLKITSKDLNKKFSLKEFVLVQFFYPFYILISASGTVFKPKWKGRKI